MNLSNTTEYQKAHHLSDEFIKSLYIATFTSSTIFIILGTFLNLWQLFAIITSNELRSRMRNKLIISTCCLHLTECTIQFPLLISLLRKSTWDCSLMSAYVNIYMVQDFIANWTLVTMNVVFIFQIMDFKAPDTLTILNRTVMTAIFLLLPWIASLVTVPLMVHIGKRTMSDDCFLPDSYVMLRSIDTAVPIALASALVVFAVVKKRQRFTRGFKSASGMQVELVSRGPEVDESSAYVTGVGVSLLCESLFTVMLLELVANIDYKTRLILTFTSGILADFRVVFMTLSWLLFSDVRARMKTWRPWYRPTAGIDLTVTYSRDQD